MTVSEPQIPYDVASRLEEGAALDSPTVSSTETFNEKPSRSDTVLSRGTSSLLAIGSRTWSTFSAVGTAVRPNTSPGKASFEVHKLEDFPEGYPRVSCLLNSDESFMMYRRFGQVHSRLLLHKQDQIRRLEAKLLRLDKFDALDEDRQMYLECSDESERRDKKIEGMSESERKQKSDEILRGPTRTSILDELEQKILEYGRLLAQARDLQSMNRPSDRDHKSVSNYFEGSSLIEQDREFLLYKEDLVSIRPGREHAWLDECVDTILRWYPNPAVKYMFCDKETRMKTNDPKIHYFSRSRVSFFVTFIITLLILVLLVVPIYILYELTVYNANTVADWECIIVLLLFTLLFSCILSSVTKAKRHEILAAAAGYCAVLVVFVGNIGKVGN